MVMAQDAQYIPFMGIIVLLVTVSSLLAEDELDINISVDDISVGALMVASLGKPAETDTLNVEKFMLPIVPLTHEKRQSEKT